MMWLIDNYIAILSAVFGFGILVFVHEFGHLIMGVMTNVKVEKFSVGMGPAVAGFYFRDIYFQIGLIPFGGFCQFKEDAVFDDLPVSLSNEKAEKLFSDPKFDSSLFFDVYKATIVEKLSEDEYVDLRMFLKPYEIDINSLYEYDKLKKSYIRLKDPNQQSVIKAIDIIISNNLQYIKYVLREESLKDFRKELVDQISGIMKMTDLRDSDSFYGTKPYKRLLIAFFGPFMNFMLAVFIFMILAMFTYSDYFIPSKVILTDDISENTIRSPASKAGMESLDKIVRINDTEISDFNEITKFMMFNEDQARLDIEVERDDQIFEYTVYPEWNPAVQKPLIGITSYIEPVISEVDNTLSEYLGLKSGDLIIAIDGENEFISDSMVNSYLISNYRTEKNGVFTVKRDENEFDVKISFLNINREIAREDFYLSFKYPKRVHRGRNIFNAVVYGFNESFTLVEDFIGGMYLLFFKSKAVPQNIDASVFQNIIEDNDIKGIKSLYDYYKLNSELDTYQLSNNLSKEEIKTVKGIFNEVGNSKNVKDQVGGPLLLGYYIGVSTKNALQDGIFIAIRNFLTLIASISMALGFMNLLPLPAVDGGHILLAFIEIISRRRINMKVMYIINAAGFFMIITLAILVFYLDISKLFF